MKKDGQSFLAAVDKEIMIKLTSLTAEEMKMAWGLKRGIKRLGEKLQMIQVLLNDADNRKVRMEAVEFWLKKLKLVAYDADDLFDQFAFEGLKRKLEIQSYEIE